MFGKYDIDTVEKYDTYYPTNIVSASAKFPLLPPREATTLDEDPPHPLLQFFDTGDYNVLVNYVRTLLEEERDMIPQVATILALVRTDDPDFHVFLPAEDEEDEEEQEERAAAASEDDPSDERASTHTPQDDDARSEALSSEEEDPSSAAPEVAQQIVIEPIASSGEEEDQKLVYPFGPHDDKYFDLSSPDYASLPLLKLLEYLLDFHPEKGNVGTLASLFDIVVILYRERERRIQEEKDFQPGDPSPSDHADLENKGLRRKALAAAFEAERKRLEQLQEKIKVLSGCLLTALTRLNDHFRTLVRQWGDVQWPVIPEELMACLDGLSNDPKDPHGCALYRLSILLWAECTAISDDPLSRVREYSSNIHSLALPDSEVLALDSCHPANHRLWALCRRLRVRGSIDRFVSHPEVYSDELSMKTVGTPHKVAPTLCWIRESLDARNDSALLELYYTLVHRLHAQVILMDGLYTFSEESNTSIMSGEKMVAGIQAKLDFCFDSTKCAQSMSLLTQSGDMRIGSNSVSVHQRASKVWGSVMSSHYFNPKSGIHRWAVRLDKCERGHVFIGVATAQAGLKTYVGGDKFGWGMIGTQALWHERKKVSETVCCLHVFRYVSH